MKAEFSKDYYYISSESDNNILRVSIKEMFDFFKKQNIGKLPKEYIDLQDEYRKQQDEFVEKILSEHIGYVGCNVKPRENIDRPKGHQDYIVGL
jgi:5-methylthioribose kinase